eukprot:scaffold16780_cov13-Tisochrysis_lutea.AAC.1
MQVRGARSRRASSLPTAQTQRMQGVLPTSPLLQLTDAGRRQFLAFNCLWRMKGPTTNFWKIN